MNKKILLVICALFFFFVNINVLAEDEYCCDGKVWDGESSCNSKGVKNGSCTKTVAISSSSTPQKLSYGESVTISNCGNSCTISSNFGDIVSATGSSVSVVKNPPNCIKEGTVSFSRNPSYSNGVKTTYTSLTLKFKSVAVWVSNPESNKVIWSRNNPTPT